MTPEPLAQEAVEAERCGVVLEDEGGAEPRLAVVEDALDAGMLNPSETAAPGRNGHLCPP